MPEWRHGWECSVSAMAEHTVYNKHRWKGFEQYQQDIAKETVLVGGDVCVCLRLESERGLSTALDVCSRDVVLVKWLFYKYVVVVVREMCSCRIYQSSYCRPHLATCRNGNGLASAKTRAAKVAHADGCPCKWYARVMQRSFTSVRLGRFKARKPPAWCRARAWGAESFVSGSWRTSARGGRMMRKGWARLAHNFVRETFDAFAFVLGVSLASLWL